MVEPSALVAFAALCVAIIVVPGPSVLFIVGRALALGRRQALLTVVGNAAGAYVQVLLVAAGLGAVVEQSIAALTVVRLVGAAYLVWLGLGAIRHRRATAAAALGEVEGSDAVTPTGDGRVLREGFVVGVTNPKLIVFLAAFLPQFVAPAGAPVPVQMALLGVIFVAVALVLDSGWGLAAGTARSWFEGDRRRLERLGGVGGMTMIGLGVHLAVTGRPDTSAP